MATKTTVAFEEAAAEADPAHEEFVRQCEDAGLTVKPYQTGGGATVPGVRCGKSREVVVAIRATRGRVTFDKSGAGYVVFPIG